MSNKFDTITDQEYINNKKIFVTHCTDLEIPSQGKTLNSNKQTIRSGEIREIKINHGDLYPGFFQSQTTLKYGAKETSITKLFSFWVNPEFFLISLVTIIFSFVLYFVFRRRKV